MKVNPKPPAPGRRRAPPRLLAALLMVGMLAGPGSAGPAPARAQNGPPELPCRVGLYRHLRPEQVEPGERVDLELRYRYDCRPPAEAPRLDVMLVVADSIAAQASPVGLERNLRAGLSTLINLLPWENGSQMGLVLYDDQALVRSPLRGGSVQRTALLGLADRFRLNRGAGALGMDAAIALAHEQLTEQGAAGPRLIVLVDLAAEPFAVLGTACHQAGQDGLRIALAQLPGAGDRAAACVNGGIWTAGDDDGGALEERLEALARQHFSPHRSTDPPTTLRFVDEIDGAFLSYLSLPLAQPPRQSGDRLSWEIPLIELVVDEAIIPYALTVIDPAGIPLPDVRPASRALEAELVFADGARQPLDLPAIDLCLARPGRKAEDCGFDATAFPLTATPTPTAWPGRSASATPTASATTGVTAAPPVSPSPSPGATPTPSPPVIHLPALHRRPPPGG